MNTNTKFPIFIIIASILTMAIFSSITNFGSASTTECFGSAKDPARFCAITYSIKEGDYIDATAYVLCTTDKDGHAQCEIVKPTVPTPEIKQAIGNAVKELAPSSNTSDSKNLGGMQSDQGITKSPIK